MAMLKSYFDPATNTVSHVVRDPGSDSCAVIDSVLDIDYAAGRLSYASADAVIRHIEAKGLRLEWMIETHVHADHLSAAAYLKDTLGGQLGIGGHIRSVQTVFGKLFNAGDDFARDGSQFDHLFADDETFSVGSLTVRALHTPGHTPACMTYVVQDTHSTAAFVGDTLFMPDYGTARCDFPGGDARTLYRSINRVLSLPADTVLYMCHDYPPNGRAVQYSTTVAEERAHNIHVKDGITEAAFVTMREARDAKLDMPVLLLPSVQINMRAGEMPPPEPNGVRYVKIPINAL